MLDMGEKGLKFWFFALGMLKMGALTHRAVDGSQPISTSLLSQQRRFTVNAANY